MTLFRWNCRHHPPGHVYLVSDDWFRGIDSRVLDALEEQQLHGKVLGYYTK